MATKKVTRKAARPRPDKYSKKRKGYISQSLRITVEEAQLIRDAAAAKGLSTNHWMTLVLIPTAKKQLAQQPTE